MAIYARISAKDIRKFLGLADKIIQRLVLDVGSLSNGLGPFMRHPCFKYSSSCACDLPRIMLYDYSFISLAMKDLLACLNQFTF